MPTILHCCCDCPTKEEAGLPDAFAAEFMIEASGDDTGMPADSVIDDCLGGDVYERWSVSTALVDLLAGLAIVFDYDHTTNCCHLYTGRSEYDPGDPYDCGGVFATPTILLGDSPFQTVYFDGGGFRFECTSHYIPPEQECKEELETGDACCADCPDPEDVWGAINYEFSGTEITFPPIVGVANAVICISGDTVTISGTVDMYMAAVARTGTYAFVSGGLSGGAVPNCDSVPEYEDDDTTTTCIDLGDGLPIATFPFSMSADLSAVSGATFWDKIKAYTSWKFDYAYGVCNNTWGCSSSFETCVGPCEVLANCYLAYKCANNDGVSTTTAADDPVDKVCLYNFGTLGVAFSDAT